MQEDKTRVFFFFARKTRVFYYGNNGHGFTGSLNPLFSMYDDYHVIDSKGTHNFNVLMVLLWWLHVLKHIGERSTPLCY